MRIYLVGYMGSGKSTIGRELANRLDLTWIDLDDEFETRYKISIPDFFSKYGETAFREIEHKILKDISLRPDIVVSTGGGSPCYLDNMQLMNQTGFTVYLKAPADLLISRIELSTRKRPLFQRMQGENFMQKISLHLESREQFYEQAKMVVSAEKPDFESLKTRIKEYYQNISG
jgi:shikimate kinase